MIGFLADVLAHPDSWGYAALLAVCGVWGWLAGKALYRATHAPTGDRGALR